jgi:serine/threonine protein kinase
MIRITDDEVAIPGHISHEAKDLIRKIFCKDSDQRITLSHIKNHPWLFNNGLGKKLLRSAQCMHFADTLIIVTEK